MSKTSIEALCNIYSQMVARKSNSNGFYDNLFNLIEYNLEFSKGT